MEAEHPSEEVNKKPKTSLPVTKLYTIYGQLTVQ